MSGLRSRNAWASPVALALTPGPSVDSTAPGAPVSSPVTAAMTQAADSWWQSTKGRPAARAASRSSRLEPPPGTPKMRWTPARRSPSIRISATVGIRGAEPLSGLAGEAGENGAHPVEGLADIRLGVSVGQAEVALAVLAEGRAAEHGHAPVLENGLRHLGGRPLERLDIGEDVEGALGRAAGHAGQLIEPRHDEIAPALELTHHLAHRHLIALQRGDARPLGERGGAGVGVDHEPGHMLGEGNGHDPIAHAPARHRIGLGEAVEDDGEVAHAGETRDRHELAFVEEGLAALVGEP